MPSLSNAEMLSFLSDQELNSVIGDIEWVAATLEKVFDTIVLSASGRDDEESKVKPEDSAYGNALQKFRMEMGTLFLKDLVWERYKRRGY